MSIVTALFKTRTDAENALKQLEQAGIAERQISMVMTDQARGTHFKLEKDSKTDEGVAAGAALGGLTGVVLGGLLAAGTIAIPGLNLVVTGALASGLAGLGAGTVVGGLVGGLIGAGIPEHEAKFYEKEIVAGNVLIAVRPDTDEQKKRVKDIFDALKDKKLAA